MTIWLYVLFGNEERIMPYFMRWYAPQVDKMIMLDGGSQDGSKDVIRQYPNAELRESPFTNVDYDDLAYTYFIQKTYPEAREQADWVLWVDIDEFLYSVMPLRSALYTYRQAGIRAITMTGCQMVADEFPEDDGRQLPDIVQVGSYDQIYDKVCAFDPELYLRWTVGRHSCAVSDYTPVKTGMKLLHYRYLGDEYLLSRNAANFKRKSAVDIAKGHGYQCAPDYTEGRYSRDWYRIILGRGQNVVENGSEKWQITAQPQN